ncbi:uncharacterized protein FIBRA_08185 [Fibroporia radiculosa]|uniref:Vacuolar protein-sorting-associated protein 36 n=1 Tax=Fibroporia radiculosa TaxID=599839 RepID=J4IC80_9APHY|nr:uncharacterized protein FIBRA_08185 [Fibroporia radiculosa]CCM05946.1 predicted protein [Fibroporia radiculosa]
MSLRRYTRGIDGTIPVQALLYEDEDLLASQEHIGIYDGTEKSAPHQSGTIHATTHRLFYIDTPQPETRSFELELAQVARTEHYAGLFTSSPKITLYLHIISLNVGSDADNSSNAPGSQVSSEDPAFRSWTCEVCSYRNPPGLSPAASRICALCGVPRSSAQSAITIPTNSASSSNLSLLSTSLPPSSLNLSRLTLSSSSSPAPGSPHTSGGNEEIACIVCTFLNHPTLATCEMCGTPLPKHSVQWPASHPQAKSAPASRPTSPSADHPDRKRADAPGSRMIRLSFRKGGDKAFYAVLRRSLLGKGWEIRSIKKGSKAGGSATAPTHSATLSGISASTILTIYELLLTESVLSKHLDGILRTVESTAATSQTDMEDALKDLEALMVKWRDMVKLAQDLNERLTAASASTSTSTPPTGATVTSAEGAAATMTTQAVEPEEATFIRSSLAQLGLQMTNAPVTLDMIRDERRWIEELARELAGVLQGSGERDKGEGIMRTRGIVGLDEVWGGWNRARGDALIPPSTFLLVLPQLPGYTSPPIQMRTFSASGLSVLHTPPFTTAAFTSRLVGLISLAGPRTVVEIAQEEALPIGLAQEMVIEVEDVGEICRDEGGPGVNATGSSNRSWHKDGWEVSGEVRWWVNIFRDYEWDGHEDQ